MHFSTVTSFASSLHYLTSLLPSYLNLLPLYISSLTSSLHTFTYFLSTYLHLLSLYLLFLPLYSHFLPLLLHSLFFLPSLTSPLSSPISSVHSLHIHPITYCIPRPSLHYSLTSLTSSLSSFVLMFFCTLLLSHHASSFLSLPSFLPSLTSSLPSLLQRTFHK